MHTRQSGLAAAAALLRAAAVGVVLCATACSGGSQPQGAGSSAGSGRRNGRQPPSKSVDQMEYETGVWHMGADPRALFLMHLAVSHY